MRTIAPFFHGSLVDDHKAEASIRAPAVRRIAKPASEIVMGAKFETVLSDADSTLRCCYFTCADLTTDHGRHYHPEYELTWVISSSGVRFIGDSIERYAAGDLVLVGPNLPHCWHNEVGANADSAELIFAQFSPASFGAGFLDLPEAVRIRELLDQAACGVHFRGEVAARVGPRLRSLVVQRGMARLLGMLELLNVLADWQDRVSLAAPSYRLENEVNIAYRRRIEQVHQYVRGNLRGNICQAEIAAKLGLTAPAFSRFFRAATERTFVNFVNLLRVNEACRLLKDPCRSITSVALECGYDNISNFNRQFLALKGMNPTEYRLHIKSVDEETPGRRLRAVS